MGVKIWTKKAAAKAIDYGKTHTWVRLVKYNGKPHLAEVGLNGEVTDQGYMASISKKGLCLDGGYEGSIAQDGSGWYVNVDKE